MTDWEVDALDSEYMELDAAEKRARRRAVLWEIHGDHEEAELERFIARDMRQRMREMHQRELAGRRDG